MINIVSWSCFGLEILAIIQMLVFLVGDYNIALGISVFAAVSIATILLRMAIKGNSLGRRRWAKIAILILTVANFAQAYFTCANRTTFNTAGAIEFVIFQVFLTYFAVICKTWECSLEQEIFFANLKYE